MTFEVQPRRAIYVYMRSLKYLGQLKKHGQVGYVSKRMNIVELYTDEEKVADLAHKLEQYRFVKHVKLSPRPDIDPDLENKHDDVFFEEYDKQVESENEE
ncbi:YlbG family protein [Eupransor demetentiae]|uniref:UPF0298 family (YlbG) n=1 Tax=Eupransor demetentiae TaxID=3109584 RepID=A0ABM9N3C7_9LACO|nr:UPF0298 family (YlbG) [Lactobacillaceae bacterium LMG 33000]